SVGLHVCLLRDFRMFHRREEQNAARDPQFARAFGADQVEEISCSSPGARGRHKYDKSPGHDRFETHEKRFGSTVRADATTQNCWCAFFPSDKAEYPRFVPIFA